MKFSLNFIKELLPITESPKDLAQILTMGGMEVEGLQKEGGDWIFDIEITTNRYDWLSIVGVAREIAACTHSKFKLKLPKINKIPAMKDKHIIIENTEDCPFYVGRIIKGVEIKESPKWLKERVTNCGISSISNVVDITNYCMLKWGNPLHAFDLDKIQGNVYVRRAKSGEHFVGIDEKERILNKENLVIADDKKVIALAGVIGGKNTEVDENTKNIFLEAAVFSPLTTRWSRRSAGVDTESSYRFERKVHPDCLEYASMQSANLIKEIACGRFCGYAEAGKKPKIKKQKVSINLNHMNAYLGGVFSVSTVKKILFNLGFEVVSANKQKIVVESPALRFDIKRDVDVYEEFARIYGYENIEATLPFLIKQGSKVLNVDVLGFLYTFKNELRSHAISLGMKEIISYSIEAEDDLKCLCEEDFIALSNPLRKQENVMRTSLLLGMIKSARHNLNRSATCLRFFEIANTYELTDKGLIEKSCLSLSTSGKDKEFFYLKGVIKELFSFLNKTNVEFKENKLPNFTNALEFFVDGLNMGFVGKLDSRVKDDFGLKEDFYFSQLDVAQLMKTKGERCFAKFSAYPVVSRDISFALSRDKKFKDAGVIIEKIGAQYFSNLSIVDEYKGKDVPQGHRVFTLRVSYQSRDKTLTSQEVDDINRRIRNELSAQAGIILR